LDINELVFAPLCLADVVATSRQKEVGVAIINVGAATTSLAVYEEGDLLHAAVIPIGADHITSDIAIGLRTSLEIADILKKQYVNAASQQVNKYEEIDLQTLGAPQSEVVSLRFVSDIAQARVEELFDKVEQELKKIDRSGMLPAGVLLTGGGVKGQGVAEVAKQVLRLPVAVAQNQIPPTALEDILRDPAFSTALGLVKWGYDSEREGEGATPRYSGGKSQALVNKIGSPLKRIFKSFIP
jgi:cell division protein FtsA